MSVVQPNQDRYDMALSEFPIEHKGYGGIPMAIQKIGDGINISSSFILQCYNRYIEELEKRVNKENPYFGVPGVQGQGLQKARGYQNSSIRQFMEYVYPTALRKDAPTLTTTTGFYNQVYGQRVWEQINNEQNAWGFLPKRPWDRSGWRVLTTAGATSGGGVAESAAPPSTIKPTLAQISTKPKVLATAFNVSALQQGLSLGGDDSVVDTIDFLRQYSAIEHGKLINRMLLTNVTTLASNNMESIDRIVSSNDEVTNCGDVDAGDSDIYSQDRDAGATWADAYVSHNSNTDRDFSLSLLDDLFTNVRPYMKGGDFKGFVLLTGWDTFEEISQHDVDKVRHLTYPQNAYLPSVNGVSAAQPGTDAGHQVVAYKGVPILVSDDVPTDTISRIYLLNLNYLFIKTLMPTMYFQTGLLSNGDPFGINFLGDEGLFVTMAELIATKFRIHGKIRDLQ